MKLSQELRGQLEELQNKAKVLISKEGVTAEEINAASKEIETLKAKITIQEQIEADEKVAAQNAIQDGNMQKLEGKKVKKDNKEAYNHAFAEFIRTKGEITPDVKNIMQEGVTEDGGALVPVIDDTSIIKLREADDALQNLVRVIPITKPEGKKTIQKRHGSNTSFKEVGEGAPIGKGETPKFYKMSYLAKKYSAIYDITEEEFDDSDENVISIMNEWIGNDSRCLRNNLILQTLNQLPKTAISTPDDIKDILNKTLRTTSERYAVVLTNQSGFNNMDKWKDSDGKYILEKDAQNGTKKIIFNKRIVVLDDEIMPNTTGKAPTIIGDLSNVLLFDRKNVGIKITTEGGEAFENDLILMRAIEREDVKLLCNDVSELARDLVYGEITVE